MDPKIHTGLGTQFEWSGAVARAHADALADRQANQAAIDAGRQDIAKKTRGLFSPAKIIDAVQVALTQPFDEGMRVERELFLQCMNSTQRPGLIHVFFAECDVVKAPETRSVQPRLIHSVGVVGGGTMGAGISVSMLDAGLPVTMIERDEEYLARGRQHVEKVYDMSIAKGLMNEAAKAATMARFNGSMHYKRSGPGRFGDRDRF